ncbi:FimV/HubP family polar landmark protein [Diaphorobacter aerolatus]|uniref:FimV/HubP family polar landmark protein n=1 Tax=Diaphorobacter aerolatus TaxID=1288495 RepID=UPI00299F61FF|nr:FimV/HubP family polar landmark protein [Diaphorobacter aerolatus]
MADAGSGEEVRVRSGETAGRIAGAHRPAGVSLDQMLVAMMRANPNAFINGNVNRLRAGTVLNIPTESQAQAVTPGEARKIIAAQSRNFNEFRRRLATAAPSADVGTPQRAATGSVQSQVDDQKAASTSSDKLTLSKGGIQSAKKDEKLAQDRQSNQNAERMAELSKNISDLNKVGAAAGSPAPAASSAASKPADLPAVATVPATAPGTSATPAASVASSAAATSAAVAASAATDAASAAVAAASAATDAASDAASAASAAASAASAPVKKPRVVAPPPPPPEPTFFESMTEDPLVLGGLGIALLALLGLGGYKLAQRRKAASLSASDSSMMDSNLAPDSFFGASGGQRVDTANSGLSTGSSSLAYSPSQLDAGEVDPVAEADVYLAYGRDLQAEEILREAARTNPERTSIHVKLAEIYAKRQDRKALEAQARELFTLTQGQGVDWARVAELGRTQDPENPFYQQSVARAAGSVAAAGVAAAAVAPRPEHLDLDAPSTLPVQFHTPTPAPVPPAALGDLDLDLDIGSSAPGPAPQNHQWTPPITATAPDTSAAKLPDFELPSLSLDTPAPAPAPGTRPASAASGLDFQLDDLAFNKPAAGAATPAAAAASNHIETTARQPLEFDLGGLSLDLNQPATGGTVHPTTAPAPLSAGLAVSMPEGPLHTKLALAEEFNAIGDSEGARTLVEEVIAESSGELKLRAQQLLSRLG